jgi:predicted MFS family arabinose efflux permease
MSRSSSGGPAYPAPGSTARCRTRLFRRAPSGLGLRNDRAVPGTASRSLILLLAAACGLIAANVYYAQPLAGSIGPAIGLSPEASGLVVTLTQIGYGAGLLLIVPLGDLIENRLLVTSMVAVTCAALAAAAWSSSAISFLPAVLLVGLGSVAVQILIPYASHLAPPETRGTLVGNVTSGLMVGVMLSRPASSWIASVSNWRVVFLSSAVTMLALAIALAVLLPPRTPESKLTYSALLASMGGLALKSSVLRQRVIYQCFLYAAFSVFWTTIPMRLMGPPLHFSQGQVALFALLGGGGGILSAPVGGRLADRGWTRGATACAMFAVAVGFLLTLVPIEGLAPEFCLLVAAAIVVDGGMTVNFTLGQRSIFVAEAEYRSRLNGLYMAFFFLAGAAGSAFGGWAYAVGGWQRVSILGVGLPLASLLSWCADLRQSTGRSAAAAPKNDNET